MAEHVPRERLSTLVEDREPTERERQHLEGCRRCGRELERLRRMRMALSAMDDLRAPADGWRRVEEALPDPAGSDAAEGARPSAADRAGAGASTGPSGPRLGVWGSAAAAAALFAGGLALGSSLGGPRPDAGGPSAGDATPRAARPADVGGSPAAATGGVAEERSPAARAGRTGVAPLETYRSPAEAAERLARLEAMMEATREALREDPADPAMNDFLFRVAEDRQELLDALHLATLEYR